MDKTMRDRAIELARQGFSVFRLKAGTKDTPIIPRGTRLKKGEYYDVVPTSDVDKVRAMWTRPDGESHNYNIGGCTNDLLVFDLDNKDGKSGTDAFVPIARELGLTEITPAARTPPGGQDRSYNLPGELHDLAPRAQHGERAGPWCRYPRLARLRGPARQPCAGRRVHMAAAARPHPHGDRQCASNGAGAVHRRAAQGRGGGWARDRTRGQE